MLMPRTGNVQTEALWTLPRAPARGGVRTLSQDAPRGLYCFASTWAQEAELRSAGSPSSALPARAFLRARLAASPSSRVWFATYQRSQHSMRESLLDLLAGHLECFKHFSFLLFETEWASDATRVHIERRDRTDRDQRPSAAMVGRTRHCSAGPPRASADLQLGRTCHRGGHPAAAAARLFPAGHAESDSLPAAGIWHQPGGYGPGGLGVSPAYGWHPSLFADLGTTGRGPIKKRPPADVRYMPER